MMIVSIKMMIFKKSRDFVYRHKIYDVIALQGNDLVERIIRNKEMGCTATKCTSLLEKDMDMCNRSFKRFFELLGGRPPIAGNFVAFKVGYVR